MKKKVLVLFAAGLFVAFSAQAQITNTDNANVLIDPDNGCVDDTSGTGLGGITRTIPFTQTGVIDDVNVSIDITHTWRADVQVGLSYSVGGGTILLANNNDTSGDNYIATFDSQAALPCSDATVCGLTAGSPCQTAPGAVCQPTGSLNVYNGLASPGTWTLTVCDRTAADAGTLNSWAVTLDGMGLPVELTGFSVD